MRTHGPLFLSERRPVPARRPAASDICPHTGRARLGYDRARVLLDKYAGLDLHQLRHSAATHLGEAEVPLQLIMGKTRHKNPRTAMRYVKPGAEAIAKITESWRHAAAHTDHASHSDSRQLRWRHPQTGRIALKNPGHLAAKLTHSATTRNRTASGDNPSPNGSLTPLAVRLLLKPRHPGVRCSGSDGPGLQRRPRRARHPAGQDRALRGRGAGDRCRGSTQGAG
ncbi:tyrosine-type recombinase/integrase [Nonomuraea sp. bgisy101]|uniref:tyrosine-type recombinase/integrase n=1 Tax=Nonomuraea sp. bgisy101 TaxID=3413784 RepID=UPI003D7210A1